MNYIYKKCFVPSCRNTSINSKKIFISVPKIKDIRKAWSVAAGRSKVPSTSSAGVYCCEDHFIMEQDCENWIAYNLFHTQLKIKKNVVPHCNLSGPSNVSKDFSQLSKAAEKRKKKNMDEYAKKQKLNSQGTTEFENESSILISTEPGTGSASFFDKSSTSGLYKSFAHKSVQVNFEITKTSVSIGVNMT